MTESDLLCTVSETICACSEAARGTTIVPETRLVEDLSLDSLDLVAVMMRLQDELGIELDLDAVPEFHLVSDLMHELERQLRSRSAA